MFQIVDLGVVVRWQGRQLFIYTRAGVLDLIQWNRPRIRRIGL